MQKARENTKGARKKRRAKIPINNFTREQPAWNVRQWRYMHKEALHFEHQRDQKFVEVSIKLRPRPNPTT